MPACALGDPEFVAIPPIAQFLTKYLFFTDPTYGTTNLVFTRVADATGFQDVILDCLGPVTGWRPIGIDGKLETATVDSSGTGSRTGRATTASTPRGAARRSASWCGDSTSAFPRVPRRGPLRAHESRRSAS